MGEQKTDQTSSKGRKGEKQWDYLPHVRWGCEAGVRNIAVAAGPGGGLQTEQAGPKSNVPTSNLHDALPSEFTQVGPRAKGMCCGIS